MGLDIGIIEHKGFNDKGYLITESPAIKNWNSDRVYIMKHFLKNMTYDVLKANVEWDFEEYYRPNNFEEAYKYMETLNEADKEYVKNILEILQTNDNYYLEYCH